MVVGGSILLTLMLLAAKQYVDEHKEEQRLYRTPYVVEQLDLEGRVLVQYDASTMPERDGLFLRFKTGDGSIVCLPAPFRYRERNK
jgi:hypothetical protein